MGRCCVCPRPAWLRLAQPPVSRAGGSSGLSRRQIRSQTSMVPFVTLRFFSWSPASGLSFPIAG